MLLLAERFVFWGVVIEVFLNMESAYVMARMSPLNSPILYLSTHP